MKNTVRAHQNGATKRTASQVQTSRNESPQPVVAETAEAKDRQEWQQHLEREFGKPTPGQKRGACLAIVDLNEMAPVSKIPLAEDELSFVLYGMGCKENEAKNFIADAIRERLSKISDGGWCSLADSLDHGVSKLQVLADLLSTYDDNGDIQVSEREKSRFDFGKFLLIRSVVDDLAKTRDHIMKMAYSKPEANLPRQA